MPPPSSVSPGSAVRVVMTKWGDLPHWEFDACYLGSDAHGDWLGIRQGTRMTRPGASYVAPADQVGLVPAPGPESQRGWLAAFHDVAGPLRLYVDVVTPPVWDGATLRTVDLDLDVVQGWTGRAWVDDEEEFAEHRVRFGYPDEVARAAIASCEWVLAAVGDARAPFDDSCTAWLARLASMPGA